MANPIVPGLVAKDAVAEPAHAILPGSEVRGRPPPGGIPFAVAGLLVLNGAGLSAVQAIMPAIGRALTLPDASIAMMFSLAALLAALTATPWSRLSDRLGRRRVMIIGLVGFIVANLSLGVAIWIGARQLVSASAAFVLMLLARAVFGLVGAAAYPACQAYIADRSSREHRTQAMSAQASLLGFGQVLGPAVAPFLVLPLVGLAGPMLALAFLGVWALGAIVHSLPSDTPRNEARQVEGLNRRATMRLAPLLASFLAIMTVQVMVVQTLGFQLIDLLDLPPSAAPRYLGAVLFAGALCGVTIQALLTRFARPNPPILLVGGLLLIILGNVLFALGRKFEVIVAAYLVLSLGAALARPGAASALSLAVGARHQGAIAGHMFTLTGVSLVVGPGVGVALQQWFPAAPYLANLGLCLVASGLVIHGLRSTASPLDPG